MEDLKPRYQIIQLTVMKKDETGKEDGDADELLSLLHDKNCFKSDNNFKQCCYIYCLKEEMMKKGGDEPVMTPTNTKALMVIKSDSSSDHLQLRTDKTRDSQVNRDA